MTYKTIFVEAETIVKNGKYAANGDQLARDVQATLVEMSQKGFELVSSNAVHSVGMMLIFRYNGITV